jgi:hypothetical protein
VHIERIGTAGEAEVDITVGEFLDDVVAILSAGINVGSKRRVVAKRIVFGHEHELLARSRSMRHKFNHTDKPGDRPVVDHHLSKIRVAKVFVLIANVDRAMKALLVFPSLCDVRTGCYETLKVLRLQLARKIRGDQINQQQTRRHNQSRPQEQAGSR